MEDFGRGKIWGGEHLLEFFPHGFLYTIFLIIVFAQQGFLEIAQTPSQKKIMARTLKELRHS